MQKTELYNRVKDSMTKVLQAFEIYESFSAVAGLTVTENWALVDLFVMPVFFAAFDNVEDGEEVNWRIKGDN